jgi:hypothetical protein
LAQVYGGALGLIAFIAIVMRGLAAGSAASTTLLTASASLPVFFVIGCVIGWIANRTLEESIWSKIETYVHMSKEVSENQS